jgi:hypothetical protein
MARIIDPRCLIHGVPLMEVPRYGKSANASWFLTNLAFATYSDGVSRLALDDFPLYGSVADNWITTKLAIGWICTQYFHTRLLVIEPLDVAVFVCAIRRYCASN